MPQDFSPSTLVVVQRKLEEVFQSGLTTQERSFMPMTAQRVLSEQTAQVDELTSNGRCTGYDVNYMFSDTVTVPTVATSAPAAVCQIPAGDTLSSQKKTFNPNIYIEETIEINDKDCDNLFKFAEKVAFNMASKMALMSRALNQKIITDLNTLAQTPTFVGDGTLNGSKIDYPAALFASPDALADWDLIANNNLLASDYLTLNGTNWRNLTFNANFKQLNDNERSLIAQLMNGNKLSWDVRELDQLLGAPISFLVDRHTSAFYNRTTYTDQLTELHDNFNTATFRLPLQYFMDNQDPTRRQVNFTYMRNGVETPIYVDVRYQRICDATKTDGGRPSTTHRWHMLVEGMYDVAPSTDAKTGIIKIEKV
jgi:hypothetical protein